MQSKIKTIFSPLNALYFLESTKNEGTFDNWFVNRFQCFTFNSQISYLRLFLHSFPNQIEMDSLCKDTLRSSFEITNKPTKVNTTKRLTVTFVYEDHFKLFIATTTAVSSTRFYSWKKLQKIFCNYGNKQLEKFRRVTGKKKFQIYIANQII